MIIFFVILTSLSFASFGNNIISFFTNNSEPEINRSLCFCGKKKLSILELIPVLSFLFQKGKCKTCNQKIPLRYLITEITFGLIGLAIYLKYGLTIKFIIIFLSLFILTIIGMIDYSSFRIPNKLLFALIPLVLINILYLPEDTLLNLILTVSLLLLLILLNSLFLKLKNKEVIGYGDIKLIGLLSVLFGFPLLFFGLWLSALLGLIGYSINKNIWNERVPFGFFIWIGFVLTELFGESILSSYLELIS